MDSKKRTPSPPPVINQSSPTHPLIEGVDYEIDEKGLLVFTRSYHLKRGYCCKNGCKHCPYGFSKKKIP